MLLRNATGHCFCLLIVVVGLNDWSVISSKCWRKRKQQSIVSCIQFICCCFFSCMQCAIHSNQLTLWLVGWQPHEQWHNWNTLSHTHTHTQSHMYIYMHTYIQPTITSLKEPFCRWRHSAPTATTFRSAFCHNSDPFGMRTTFKQFFLWVFHYRCCWFRLFWVCVGFSLNAGRLPSAISSRWAFLLSDFPIDSTRPTCSCVGGWCVVIQVKALWLTFTANDVRFGWTRPIRNQQKTCHNHRLVILTLRLETRLYSSTKSSEVIAQSNRFHKLIIIPQQGIQQQQASHSTHAWCESLANRVSFQGISRLAIHQVPSKNFLNENKEIFAEFSLEEKRNKEKYSKIKNSNQNDSSNEKLCVAINMKKLSVGCDCVRRVMNDERQRKRA